MQPFLLAPRRIGSDGFESTVPWLGSLGFHIAQVSQVMTMKTGIQGGPRNVGIKELRHHGQKIIKRHQKRLAQGHCDGLLRGRQHRLQPVRPVAAILNAVTLAPFPHGLFRRPMAFLKNPGRLIAGLNCRSELRCRGCLAVRLIQHVVLPSRTSLKTLLAMKRAD